MVVDSEQPHFVGVDSDILSTGLVFYYLKVSNCVEHVQVVIFSAVCLLGEEYVLCGATALLHTGTAIFVVGVTLFCISEQLYTV